MSGGATDVAIVDAVTVAVACERRLPCRQNAHFAQTFCKALRVIYAYFTPHQPLQLRKRKRACRRRPRLRAGSDRSGGYGRSKWWRLSGIDDQLWRQV